jgi:membrane-associated protein
VDTGGVVGSLPGPSSLGTLGTAAVYAVVIGFVFVECGLLVGFLLPGDTLLVAAGVVAGQPSHGVNIGWLASGVFVAAVAGEILGYVIGARAGLPLLRRQNGRVLNPRNLARAEQFTVRYGMFAVIAARWVPWVRTFAPVLAGATRMPWPRFMVANVVGALCWAPTLVLVGYSAASAPVLRHVSLLAAAVVTAAAVTVGAVRYWRLFRHRERAGARTTGHRRNRQPGDGEDG